MPSSGKERKVPGIPKDKLDITVIDRDIKIVEGEAKTGIDEDREGFVRRERGYSKVLGTLSRFQRRSFQTRPMRT